MQKCIHLYMRVHLFQRAPWSGACPVAIIQRCDALGHCAHGHLAHPGRLAPYGWAFDPKQLPYIRKGFGKGGPSFAVDACMVYILVPYAYNFIHFVDVFSV